jgi:hypothetical protein
MVCPNCNSKDIKKIERINDNGIIGPGYKQWVVDKYYSCNNCKLRFDE